ncbi:MAG: L-histidine N(alpha)-methyltransferase [Actinomycetes bacterium]
MSTTDHITVERLSTPRSLRAQLEDDLAVGMADDPRWLPPKYFYDAVGSALFEDITELEEYYPTRTETAILERVAPDVVATCSPVEVLELGSGSSRKTRLLLEAMRAHGSGTRYVPLDVSEAAVRGAAEALTRVYPWLDVHGFVGDFHDDLGRIPPPDGPRLVAFLGSTIGNQDRSGRADLLGRIASLLRPEDRLVLGADLVKDPSVLVAAYDDARGVTAEFDRNMLRVVGAELGADLRADSFTHEARWDPEHERIEMWLHATEEVTIPAVGDAPAVVLEPGDAIRTELSCKFRPEGLREELADAGLEVERFDTDEAGWFALVTARRAAPGAAHPTDGA